MTDKTPSSLGYRMPAEWEKHSAVWLAWPHDKISFGTLNLPPGTEDPTLLKKAERTLVEIIKAIHTNEPVELLVLDEKMKEHAEQALRLADVDISKVTFNITDYADIWLRDYGPAFIQNSSTHELSWVKWDYNAYGSKFEALLKDNKVFLNLRSKIDKRMFEPGIVLESGAIEVNGKGTLITTEQCLLSPSRNPQLTKKQTEDYLKNYLGVTNVIWLREGLVNDHTDGHIDEIVRFVNPTTIVCAYEDNPEDENFKILDENFKALRKATDQDGKPFRLIKLPMPHMKYRDGEKTPVSYANFYIGNKVVLAAIFNDPNDQKALDVIQSCFPDRKVIGIDCSDIIYGGGAIHCMTQQQPA